MSNKTDTPLWVRELARDIHYAITDDGLAPLSPTDNNAMREAILRALTTDRLAALRAVSGGREEPVAWRYRYFDSDGWTYQQERPNDPPTGNPDGKVFEPLYTAPAVTAGEGDAPKWWIVGSEAFTSEAEAVEAIRQWGPSGAIAVPAYAAPTPDEPAGREATLARLQNPATLRLHLGDLEGFELRLAQAAVLFAVSQLMPEQQETSHG